MRAYVQSGHCPDRVLLAFDHAINPRVERIRWAVAYATLTGCELLSSTLKARVNAQWWSTLKKEFIIALDYGFTEPDAIEYLMRLPNSEVFIAGVDALDSSRLSPSRAFHPKLYLFDMPDSTAYIIGSANLTKAALCFNDEVVLACQADCSIGPLWEEWLSYRTSSVPLSNEILERYRVMHKRVKTNFSLEVGLQERNPREELRTVLSAGDTDLTEFDNFWIDAGSMSSSASRSQLELPRGGHRFFGFEFNDYGHKQRRIGEARLCVNGNVKVKHLAWHGDNRMERINLLTVNQGGLRYEHTRVLFSRVEGGFDVLLVSPMSNLGKTWYRNSRDNGMLFKVGRHHSQRKCGFF